MKKILAQSNAKINLNLKIIEKCEKLHRLDSIFVPIKNLYDNLEFTFIESSENIINFSSNIENQDNFDGDNNLIIKAAKAFLNHAKISNCHVDIKLDKNIPIGGGMGGGSSNAATVLNVFNNYFNNIISWDDLTKIAYSLGSDVPFFLYNKIAHITNFGEQIEVINSNKLELFFVIINPKFPVSTAWAFKNLNPEVFEKNKNNNSSFNIIKALTSNDFKLLEENIENDFNEILFHKFPIYSIIEDVIKQHNNNTFSISGSGSSAFAVCQNKIEQQTILHALRDTFKSENFLITSGSIEA